MASSLALPHTTDKEVQPALLSPITALASQTPTERLPTAKRGGVVTPMEVVGT